MLPIPGRPAFGIFVRDQVEDLRRLGLEVDVLFVNGFESSVNYARGSIALRRRLSARTFDLVHAHYGLTGATAITQRRVPVVTTFHGSDCSGEIPWQKAVSWVVARRCTPIFVSEGLAASVGREGAAVIPAAVDADLFRPGDRTEARRRLGWPLEGTIALLPGSRSNAVKDPALFDAALEAARRSIPELVGTSLERLSRSEVVLAMNAADVIVMTSRAEGSPVTVRESLACGTPVVSVPVGDVRSLLAGVPGCSVVARDARSIGEAIVAVVGAGGAQERRARAAEFGRPRIAERVAEIYREVVARG